MFSFILSTASLEPIRIFAKVEGDESSKKININDFKHDQLKEIPISENKINAIINYLQYANNISTIYQLLEIDEINSYDLNILKKYIYIGEANISDFIKNQKMSSYKLEYWFSSDGNQESLSDIWLDRFFSPKNINKMSYDEVYSLPNVSPIDAVGIMRQKERGEIRGTFELKNSPGLSYYGYKNILDFIKFQDQKDQGLHFRYSTLIKTLPITNNPDEEGNSDIIINNNDNPETLHRLTVFGNNFKLGMLFYQNMGEIEGVHTKKFSISFDDINFKSIGIPVYGKHIIGNYNVVFGQGVIMETTDYFSPRRTGYGFTKRAEGISSDLSRSSQYLMQGIASQYVLDLSESSNIRFTQFISMHSRDAIINEDGSFCSLITMQPRLEWGFNQNQDKIYHPLTASVNELTFGGNVRFSPTLSSSIGFTFYESLYDRVLDASRNQILGTILGGDDPGYSGDEYYGNYITNSADPEIEAMYSSSGTSDIWDEALSYRRIMGFDFSTVYKNLAIQGEYGEIFNDSNFKFGRGPSALVVNSYLQFDNFNLLLLYRNYDIDYDNPYQRSFSNYQRYKTSIFEDTYWLEDPVYGFLYSGNPQPQAEEGFYIASRYQIARNLVTTLNWDTWNRKADNSKYYRIVSTFDWRPVFNYRFKIRQKWQARGDFNIAHPSPYYSRETRVTARLRLSSYNSVELLYSNGNTTFSPRPRLTNNSMMGETMVGDVGSPDESIGFSFIHNASSNFKIKFGGLYVNGFLWYVEDSDFRVFSEDSGAFHSWVSFRMIASNNLTMNFKVSNTKQFTSTTIKEAQSSNDTWVQNPTTNNEGLDFRVQLDYVL